MCVLLKQTYHTQLCEIIMASNIVKNTTILILYTPHVLLQCNKLRKAYVMSGAVMIETSDGQKIMITDLKHLTRHQ